MVAQETGDESAFHSASAALSAGAGDLEKGGLDLEQLPGGLEAFAAAPPAVERDHAGLGENPVGHAFEGVEVGAVGHRLGDGPDEVAPFEDRLLGGEPLGADQPLGQARWPHPRR